MYAGVLLEIKSPHAGDGPRCVVKRRRGRVRIVGSVYGGGCRCGKTTTKWKVLFEE